MPTVEAVPLMDFQHDTIRARNGVPLQIDHQLALDLERQALVRIRVAPLRGRRILGVDPGKVQAAGVELPSSSSQAAQVSTSTTSNSSERGETSTSKRGKS